MCINDNKHEYNAYFSFLRIMMKIEKFRIMQSFRGWNIELSKEAVNKKGRLGSGSILVRNTKTQAHVALPFSN